jgi:hypothetical protein
MELKDVILSTLAEMEDVKEAEVSNPLVESVIPAQVQKVPEEQIITPVEEKDDSLVDSEMLYLSSIKERLLVLFEGFQAPNNTNIEAKVDMTLNFLEYTLATIDSRITALEKGEK